MAKGAKIVSILSLCKNISWTTEFHLNPNQLISEIEFCNEVTCIKPALRGKYLMLSRKSQSTMTFYNVTTSVIDYLVYMFLTLNASQLTRLNRTKSTTLKSGLFLQLHLVVMTETCTKRFTFVNNKCITLLFLSPLCSRSSNWPWHISAPPFKPVVLCFIS